MFTPKLKSSVLATAAGSFIVLAAVAASSITQPTSEVGVKGDRLMLPTKVSCSVDCTGSEDAMDRTFATEARHDTDAGITQLIREDVTGR
ncbi:MAG: hypothetical protein AAGB11_13370 [Pseudomonadota bacterium]